MLTAYVHPEEGGFLAHVPAVPGSAATGPTPELAAAKARAIAREEAPIAREQGFPIPSLEDGPTVQVTETCLLPGDVDPLSTDELPRWLARLAWTRQRTLHLVGALSGEAIHRPREGVWSVAYALEHLAQVQGWAALHLGAWPPEPPGMLEMAAAALVQALERLDQPSLGRTTHHYGMDWTPRKVLRRSVETIVDIQARVQRLRRGAAVSPPGFYWDGCSTQPQDRSPLSEVERAAGLEQLASLLDEVRHAAGPVENMRPDARRARDTLLRWLAGALWYYRTRLEPWPDDVFARLALTHAQLTTRLASLGGSERAMVYWSFYGEPWTVRKLLRRQLEHERQHFDQLRAWLATTR